MELGGKKGEKVRGQEIHPRHFGRGSLVHSVVVVVVVVVQTGCELDLPLG